MALYTVTTEDFETVAVRVPLDTAAAVTGCWPYELRRTLDEFGVALNDRFIVECAPHPSRRDGWVHPDYR